MTELTLFFISSIIGTIGHFLYNFFNKSIFIGFFFSKNESTFEHLKLGITPILLLSIVEKFIFMNNYLLSIKGIQIFIFSILIIIFFYGRKLFIKKDNALYNIILFYVSLFISYLCSFLLLNIIDFPILFNIFGIISLCIFIFLYFYSAIFKPDFLIFKNPLDQVKD